MKCIYYVNGWREGVNYFLYLCRPSIAEYNRMVDGEVITKGKNTFHIEVVEK